MAQVWVRIGDWIGTHPFEALGLLLAIIIVSGAIALVRVR